MKKFNLCDFTGWITWEFKDHISIDRMDESKDLCKSCKQKNECMTKGPCTVTCTGYEKEVRKDIWKVAEEIAKKLLLYLK